MTNNPAIPYMAARSRLKKIMGSLYFWVLLWATLVVYYFLSLKFNYYEKHADHVVYAVQLSIDCCLGYASFLAYRKNRHCKSNQFFFLMFLSLIPGLTANESYNVLINILRIDDALKIKIIWVLPYMCFLAIQIFAWSYLLYLKRQKSQQVSWISRLPYIQSAIMIFAAIFFAVAFKGMILKNMGEMGIIDSTLEFILIILISICLSRTKNTSLVYIEVGFLFVLAFNLAHRFSYISGHYYKTFDVVWLICLLVLISGFFKAASSEIKEIEFFKKESIHALSSGIFMIFAMAMFGIYVLLGFLISSVEINDMASINILPENIPAILVFSFSLSILAGKFVANYISGPIEIISEKIECIQKNLAFPESLQKTRLQIHEIANMEEFIFKTISELHVANRVKSEFLMSMSHDFRTPASGIYHMSRSVYKKITDDNLKALQKLVVDSSEQLMSFLDEVLDYSHLDGGEVKLNITKFDIIAVAHDVVLFVSAKAKEKALVIEENFQSDHINCIGDQFLVHRIILNIVSNAIKFTEIGGITLSIYEENVEKNRWLVIGIQDTGIGIDEKYHNTIFEPFYRVESSETVKQTGLGLGLSNVSLMLRKIHGKISVESRLGKGTTFTVRLPVRFKG